MRRIVGGVLGSRIAEDSLSEVAIGPPVRINGLEFAHGDCWLLLYDGRLGTVPLEVSTQGGKEPVLFSEVCDLAEAENTAAPLPTTGWQSLSFVPHDLVASVCSTLRIDSKVDNDAVLKEAEAVFLATNAPAGRLVCFEVLRALHGPKGAAGGLPRARVLSELSLDAQNANKIAWDEGSFLVRGTAGSDKQSCAIVTTDAYYGTFSAILSDSIGRPRFRPVTISRTGTVYLEGGVQVGSGAILDDRQGRLYRVGNISGKNAWRSAHCVLDLPGLAEHAEDLAWSPSRGLWMATDEALVKVPNMVLWPVAGSVIGIIRHHVEVVAILVLIEALLLLIAESAEMRRTGPRPAQSSP